MREELFRELMQSPLDEERRLGGRARLLAIGSSAAALGAAVVLAVGLLTGGDTAAEPLAAAADTTTTSAPATTTTTRPVFTPSGDRLGLRPDWVLERAGRLYVSVTSAVTAGTEPASVARMEAGLWFLDTGTDRVEFTTEYVNPSINGRITVEFPATTATGLQVIPGTAAAVEREQRASVTSMPFTGPLEEERIPLARAVELVIDDVEVGRDSGAITWHLEGGTTEHARVGVIVDFLDGEEPLGSVLTRHSLEFFAFLRAAATPPGPTRSGVAILAIPFGTSIDPDRVDGALLRWAVDVFHYEEDAIDVPLDDVTTVVVDDD